MRIVTVFLTILVLAASTAALAGQNPQVTLPLHVKASGFEACTGYQPVDCTSTRPTVEIAAGPAAIFLLMMNYNCIAGVQTAFEVEGWTFGFGLWDCQPGQLSAVTPAAPLGPTAGSITTAFNFLNGPALAVAGRIFLTASTGCISQVQSTYPFGIHVLDCEGGIDQITDQEQGRVGKVCVGPGGVDACDPVSAVESSTWGQIKASF